MPSQRAGTEKKVDCYHCGSECPDLHIRNGDKYFCCEGCKLVFGLLEENQMCNYYDLNAHPGLQQKFSAWREKFAFLDLPEMHERYVQFSDGRQSHVHFFLPQMHCSSCLWLLENIRKIEPGIVYSRVQFEHKKIHIVFDEERIGLRRVVELLTTLGYEPQLDIPDQMPGNTIAFEKNRIVKIGIAGFCFANIMMFSLPDYFSGGAIMERELGRMFTGLIILLSLPVLFYCASEFFVGAWKGLKARYVNIDLPVALAVALTFGRSLYEIQAGLGNGYLDSMSGIVFFMLVGRFIQDKSYQALSFDRNYRSFFPIAVHRIYEDKPIPVPIEKLKMGDRILIHNQEIIPVDGWIIKGEAAFDYSFVSGESEIVYAHEGERVYAGARQTGSMIEVEVAKPVSQSYLTSLWNREIFDSVDERQKSRIDSMAKYFTIVVLVLAFSAAAYWNLQGRPDRMWNALTTILIVACPCALLLASNYTNGNILKILARNKLYLRHSDVLERLSKTNHIVFDKTGTLTVDKAAALHYRGEALPPDVFRRVYALLAQSTHPLSTAIVKSFVHVKPMEVRHFKQTEGQGIEAWIEERHVKIGSASFVGYKGEEDTHEGSSIHICEEGKYYGCYMVQQHYREGLANVLESLRNSYRISVVSGDNTKEKAFLSTLLPDSSQLRFKASPSDKLEYIETLQRDQGHKTLMIGDGLNDAGALKQSDVGIAVTENKNNFTPACDGILDGSSFIKIPQLLSFVKDGRNIINGIFIYSIVYNVVGSYFALRGELAPVVAAILMPASSLSIIGLAFGITEWAAKRRKLAK